MERDGTLSGKTALVIGASSGIGLSTANLFVEAGARVHAAARRKEAIEAGTDGRGVVAVVIRNGTPPHSVLLELFTEHAAGTLIGP